MEYYEKNRPSVSFLAVSFGVMLYDMTLNQNHIYSNVNSVWSTGKSISTF